MPQLIVVEGPNMGDCFDLVGYQTIGTGDGSTIQLKDRRISGTQLKILHQGRQCNIYNLDASKNLLINGEVMVQGILRHGDMISLCDTLMLYSDDEETERSSLEEELSLEHSQIFARKPIDLEDSQLFNREEDFSEKLYTLYQIGSAILEHSETEELCLRVLKIIYQEFKFQRGAIFLQNASHPLKQIVALKNGQKYPKSIECSTTIIKHVLANQEAILSKNAQKDARFISKRSIAEFQILSCMCVPILFQGNLLGVINIDSSQAGKPYTSNDLDQLSKIGTQVGLALENITNQSAVEESNRLLKSLNKASQWLSSNLDKSNIIKEASTSAMSILKCQRVSFICLQENAKNASIAFAVGVKRELWPKIQIEVENSLVGQVIQSNQPFIYPTETSNPLLRLWKKSTHHTYRTESFLIVPVSIEDASTNSIQRLGALCVTDKFNGSNFTQSDLEHLQILASQAGISLKNAELYEKATIDSLTKIYVRQYFFNKLEELLESELSFSLLLLDLDHFKSVNDTYGHPTGDEILRETGALLKEIAGSKGYACRYGGEEFAILLPKFSFTEAQKMAEQINEAFRQYRFNRRLQPIISCTVSIGIAIRKPEEQSSSIIARADKALYLTKAAGRDHYASLPDEEIAS